MPTVELKIGNQTHNISCGEGEEERLHILAMMVDDRFNKLAEHLRPASDNFIMAALAVTMEDEIATLKENNPNTDNSEKNREDFNNSFADTLDPVTNFIEKLAIKLENA